MAAPTVTIQHLNSYWRAKAGLTPDGPQGLPSYFDLTLAGNPYYAGLGWLDAWCLDPNVPLLGSNSTYTASLYSSYELNLLPPGVFGPPVPDAVPAGNLDLVNWVINQQFQTNPQFNYGEVQAAIWKLLGYGDITTGGDLTADGEVLLSDVQIIYNASLTHDGFVPDTNQKIAVILDLGPDKQPLIVEMPAAKLGDFVWHDCDADGAQDAGEAGIGGARVDLVRDLTGDGDFDDANEVLATTTTDATGYYEFKGLTPGLPYQVRFSMPSGFDAASPRQASGVAASLDSDGLTSDTVILAPGEFNSTIDAGFYKFAKLGDFVWLDKNADGVQNAGETGIGGVTVTLLADTDNDTFVDDVVATQSTDASGFYQFDGLTPGRQYKVEFTNPDSAGADAYVFSPRQTPGDSGKDSDGPLSDTVVLKSGEYNPTIDAGLYRKGSIHVFGFLDCDGDGVLDSGEGAFPSNPGKTIQLLNAQGEVIDTQVTNAYGEAWFEGLTPGVYTVRENPVPSGYVLTTPASVTVVVNSGEEHVYKYDAAMLPPGDQRTEVLNTSLVFGNAPFGIDVEKYVRGRYQVESGGGEGLTPGFWKTHSLYGPAPLAGWPETSYSPNNSYESIFGVNVPGTPTLLDALNSNGGGLNALMRHSTAALLNADNPYVDYAYTKAQVISMTQAAIASGNYDGTKNLFEKQNELGADLNTPASGGVFVETGNVDADTAGSGPVIPVGGQAIFTYVVKNTGIFELSNVKLTDDRIASLTFLGGDTDGDGKLDVHETWKYIAKETVGPNTQYVNVATVTGEAAGYTATDADAAHYTTSPLTSSIGNRVWHDVDMDGIQDAGEAGIAGVTVKLRNSSGTVLQTTTTDANGEYVFDVNPGTYSVAFVKPAGYAFTGTDKGTSDALDSDASSTGVTGTFSIAAGQQKLTVDAGLYVNAPKFFVVDSYADDMFKYNPDGGSLGSFDLKTGNTSPTGVAANMDGSKLWVLDSNKNIYVQRPDGTSLGQWKAGDLGKAPEGIAVWGQDVWIVDSGAKKIFWYDNAASLTSGTVSANKTFVLDKAIAAPKGIATDGNYLWLVNDGAPDKVFVFKVGGAVESNPTLTPLGSWTLASGNSKPTGITIDPTGSSNSIWIVDDGTNQVYEYANARGLTSGSGPTPTTFKLASGNSNPQDIADPLALLHKPEDAPIALSDILAPVGHDVLNGEGLASGSLSGFFECPAPPSEAVSLAMQHAMPEISLLQPQQAPVDFFV